MIDWGVDTPPQPERVELRTFDQALDWGDAWMRSHARLQNEYDRLSWRCEYYESLLRHLDPYLPRWLQDDEQRAANEALYETLANSRKDVL